MVRRDLTPKSAGLDKWMLLLLLAKIKERFLGTNRIFLPLEENLYRMCSVRSNKESVTVFTRPTFLSTEPRFRL